jgi:hypothetical protein
MATLQLSPIISKVRKTYSKNKPDNPIFFSLKIFRKIQFLTIEYIFQNSTSPQ